MQRTKINKKTKRQKTKRRSQKGGLVNRTFCKDGTEKYPRPALDPRSYDKKKN
jgi:hypothetical protein